MPLTLQQIQDKITNEFENQGMVYFLDEGLQVERGNKPLVSRGLAPNRYVYSVCTSSQYLFLSDSISTVSQLIYDYLNP